MPSLVISIAGSLLVMPQFDLGARGLLGMAPHHPIVGKVGKSNGILLLVGPNGNLQADKMEGSLTGGVACATGYGVNDAD